MMHEPLTPEQVQDFREKHGVRAIYRKETPPGVFLTLALEGESIPYPSLNRDEPDLQVRKVRALYAKNDDRYTAVTVLELYVVGILRHGIEIDIPVHRDAQVQVPKELRDFLYAIRESDEVTKPLYEV